MADALSSILGMKSYQAPRVAQPRKPIPGMDVYGEMAYNQDEQADILDDMEDDRQYRRAKDRTSDLARFEESDPYVVQQSRGRHQDVMEKLLAPLQMRGEYDVLAERTRGEATVQAAQANAEQRALTAQAQQEATAARQQASQAAVSQRTFQNNFNNDIFRRATAEEKKGDGFMAGWLGIGETSKERADKIRSQAVMGNGDAGPGATDPDSIAQELFSKRQDATPDEVSRALSKGGVTEGRDVEATINAYMRLQRGGGY